MVAFLCWSSLIAVAFAPGFVASSEEVDLHTFAATNLTYQPLWVVARSDSCLLALQTTSCYLWAPSPSISGRRGAPWLRTFGSSSWSSSCGSAACWKQASRHLWLHYHFLLARHCRPALEYWCVYGELSSFCGALGRLQQPLHAGSFPWHLITLATIRHNSLYPVLQFKDDFYHFFCQSPLYQPSLSYSGRGWSVLLGLWSPGSHLSDQCLNEQAMRKQWYRRFPFRVDLIALESHIWSLLQCLSGTSTLILVYYS